MNIRNPVDHGALVFSISREFRQERTKTLAHSPHNVIYCQEINYGPCNQILSGDANSFVCVEWTRGAGEAGRAGNHFGNRCTGWSPPKVTFGYMLDNVTQLTCFRVLFHIPCTYPVPLIRLRKVQFAAIRTHWFDRMFV